MGISQAALSKGKLAHRFKHGVKLKHLLLTHKSYIIFDDFNRDDDPTNIGTSTSGHTWDRSLESKTVWGIIGEQLRITTTSAGVSPILLMDDEISPTVKPKRLSIDVLISACQLKLLFRYTNQANHYYVILYPTGLLGIGKFVGGAHGVVVNNFASGYSSGSTIKLGVEDDGSILKLLVNDDVIYTSGTQIDLNTNSKTGLGFATTDSTSLKSLRLDNYKVELV